MIGELVEIVGDARFSDLANELRQNFLVLRGRICSLLATARFIIIGTGSHACIHLK